MEYIENICSENERLKEKLEKASEALITFHNKIMKDQQEIEDLEKKYNEEKKIRMLLESTIEQTNPKRKSIGSTPPSSPLKSETIFSSTSLNHVDSLSRSRSRTSFSLEIPRDDKSCLRGSCRVCPCKGFSSVNSTWLCSCGHVNLKHNVV